MRTPLVSSQGPTTMRAVFCKHPQPGARPRTTHGWPGTPTGTPTGTGTGPGPGPGTRCTQCDATWRRPLGLQTADGRAGLSAAPAPAAGGQPPSPDTRFVTGRPCVESSWRAIRFRLPSFARLPLPPVSRAFLTHHSSFSPPIRSRSFFFPLPSLLAALLLAQRPLVTPPLCTLHSYCSLFKYWRRQNKAPGPAPRLRLQHLIAPFVRPLFPCCCFPPAINTVLHRFHSKPAARSTSSFWM
jgi:hypothetical protein